MDFQTFVSETPLWLLIIFGTVYAAMWIFFFILMYRLWWKK